MVCLQVPVLGAQSRLMSLEVRFPQGEELQLCVGWPLCVTTLPYMGNGDEVYLGTGVQESIVDPCLPLNSTSLREESRAGNHLPAAVWLSVTPGRCRRQRHQQPWRATQHPV